MKKVTGYIDIRALGCYDFEFYVEDDATDEEIKEQVDKVCNYYIDYEVEEGYEAYTETCYRKKGSRF
nr:MAG TPA: Saposin-like type B, region 1 [Caudoviricetes sp.]